MHTFTNLRVSVYGQPASVWGYPQTKELRRDVIPWLFTKEVGDSCFLKERNFLGDFSDTAVFKLGFLSFKSVLGGVGVER